MKNSIIRFGLIAGAILAALGFLTRFLWISPEGKFDMATGELVGYINMIVALSMIYFGIRQVRDNHLGGTISFGRAFTVGFLIALIASALYVIWWMIYYHTSEIAQTFPAQYLDYMRTKWEQSGVSAEEIAKKVADFDRNMKLYENPFVMIAFTLFEILPVGILVTLISAFILKKK